MGVRQAAIAEALGCSGGSVYRVTKQANVVVHSHLGEILNDFMMMTVLGRRARTNLPNDPIRGAEGY